MIFRILISFSLYACFIVSAFAQDIPVEQNYALTENGAFQSPALEARAIEIFREIKCPICTTQSVAESDAEISKTLRVHIRDEIITGKSNQEIYEALANSYGDAILLRPRFSPSTLPLWIAPWLFVLIGLIVWRRIHGASSKERVS